MDKQIIKHGGISSFRERLLQNSSLLYLGVITCAFGIFIGSCLCALLSNIEVGGINGFFGMNTVFNEKTTFFDAFLSFFISDLRLLIIFFIFGFTIFGLPAYVIIQLFAGFSLGFSGLVLFSSHGLFALLPLGLCLIPRLLLFITGLSFMAKTFLPISYKILEIFRKDAIMIEKQHVFVGNCVYSMAFALVLMACGAILCALVAVF